MTDNRNTILAVILSGLVLIGWQYFFNLPQMEKQRAAEQAQSELTKPAPQAEAATTPASRAGADAVGQRAGATQPASTAPSSTAIPPLPSTPRIKIDTPRVSRQHRR